MMAMFISADGAHPADKFENPAINGEVRQILLDAFFKAPQCSMNVTGSHIAVLQAGPRRGNGFKTQLKTVTAQPTREVLSHPLWIGEMPNRFAENLLQNVLCS